MSPPQGDKKNFAIKKGGPWITKSLQSSGRLKGACVEAESAASSPNRGHWGSFDSSEAGPSF